MFLLLMACAPEDALGDSAPTCDVTIDSTDPSTGSLDHYFRGPLLFELSEPDPTAQVIAPFAGTQTVDGDYVVFTPDEPLEPDTDYTVVFDYCHGAPEISFSTSSLGAPVEDTSALVGRTYAIDFSEGRFLEGDDIGELLSTFFGRSLLIQVLSYDEDGVDLRVAVSRTGSTQQEPCRRTTDLEGMDVSESPYFSFATDEFSFGAYEGELTFLDFAVDGTFAADGGSVGGVGFSLTLRVSELVPILGVGDEDELCELADQLGVACEVCGGQTCVTVSADRIAGPAIEVDLVSLDPEDIPPECFEEE
jgi:hypothetical protein